MLWDSDAGIGDRLGWEYAPGDSTKGHKLDRRRGSLWLLVLGAVLSGAVLSACGTSAAKPVNRSLATKAYQSYFTVVTNTPGLIGSGLPKNQSWSQVFSSALTDAKTSGDGRLYRAIQSTSPFITGSYEMAAILASPNSPASRSIRAQFSHAESKVNTVNDLCGPYGVTLPAIG
jgi:hypothetical protein